MRLSKLFLFLLFFSCKQKIDYSKEITRLDSAVAVLTSAEQILHSADTAFLKRTMDSAAVKLSRISEKIKHDTLDKPVAMFLSNAYDHSGNILNFLENRNHLQRAVLESKNRMSNLKHDLAEDLIEQNKSAAYIVSEISAAAKISDMIKSSVNNASVSSAKLDSMQSQIAQFADSIYSK